MMSSKQTMRTLAALLVLVLLVGAGAAGAQDGGVDQVSCGESLTCTMSGSILTLRNAGSGNAFFGRADGAGSGVFGRGFRGVFGKTYHAAGAGVRAEAEGSGYGLLANSDGGYAIYGFSGNYRGAYLRSGGDAYPDLVLGGNSASVDNGTILSEPTDPDSDLVFYGMDKVQIHLDEDNNTAGENFRIYNGANGVIMQLDDNGELYIADDLHLDTDGGFGEIYATGASNSRMYLYSNSWMNAYLDENDDEAVTCFNIYGSPGLLWQVCESKGTTAVGSQAVAVETSSGSREMYTIGSPGLWFEDFGSAALVDGQAQVELDALFAETVNLNVEYQVYLTPVSSEAILLFVTEKTPTAFTVQGVTLDGSPAAASFDYRIVAKRLGYERQRLEQVDLTATEAEP